MSTLNRDGLNQRKNQLIPTNNNEEVSAEDVRAVITDLNDSKFNLLDDDSNDINTGDILFKEFIPKIGDYLKFLAQQQPVLLFYVQARLGAISSIINGVRLEGSVTSNLPSGYNVSMSDTDGDNGGVFIISVAGDLVNLLGVNQFNAIANASELQNINVSLGWTGSGSNNAAIISQQNQGGAFSFRVGSFATPTGSTFYTCRYDFYSVPNNQYLVEL